MKKRIFLIFTVLAVILCSCGCSGNKTDGKTTTGEDLSTGQKQIYTEITAEGLVLPRVSEENKTKLSLKRICDDSSFYVQNVTSNYLYGQEEVLGDNGESETVRKVRNISTGKDTVVKFNDKVKNWRYAAGSYIVMQDRYRYEWYEGENGKVYLTKIDFTTGVMTIEDEVSSTSPMIYLCKLDEENFISYYHYKETAMKTPYSVMTTLTIYNVNGTKKEIVKEGYENSTKWYNSKGVLFERFFCDNGVIYGLEHGQTDGKEFYRLCTLDRDGNITQKKELSGLDRIVGSDSFVVMEKRGAYLAFRLYDGLVNCVCRISADGTVQTVMLGSATAKCAWAVTDDYILLLESNVDPSSGKVRKEPCPVYAVNARTDEITEIEVDVPVNEAAFEFIEAVADDTVVLSYCENGTYDSLKIFQFSLSEKDIKAVS